MIAALCIIARHTAPAHEEVTNGSEPYLWLQLTKARMAWNQLIWRSGRVTCCPGFLFCNGAAGRAGCILRPAVFKRGSTVVASPQQRTSTNSNDLVKTLGLSRRQSAPTRLSSEKIHTPAAFLLTHVKTMLFAIWFNRFN